jgi:beta-glucan synthesis-associated protein KRE6
VAKNVSLCADMTNFVLPPASFSFSGKGAEISSEPSYILLNTAVSTEWGFPKTCPGDCPCLKYNCNAKDYKQKCGFSEGFCEMMTGAQSPPKYRINWVRVYQDPNEEAQKVGCSTPERPTRKFIEAHEKLYKTEEDVSSRRKILCHVMLPC